jgi:preprotein translocase subunit SecD
MAQYMANTSTRARIFAAVIILLVGGIYFFTNKIDFKLGLDLNGGTHLTYQADVSQIPSNEINESMTALRAIIERRINALGVAEPIVQVEQGSIAGQNVHKLIVELPGVSDVNKATEIIGQTPTLDFRLVSTEVSTSTRATSTASSTVNFIPTGLTGRLIKRANVEFNPNTSEPLVSLEFNEEGKDLFAKITEENVGREIAIFLDGTPISAPVVREPIKDGRAQISGNFTVEEARELVRNLNYGALPVPIQLVGTQTIGASLGQDALTDSVKAGIIGFIIVALFLIIWYRLPGLIATISLIVYIALNLIIFKLIPVTLTSTGLAGFILSIGMAVDANILIFERMKEEFRRGLSLEEAIREGFSRAWFSIRDGNLSSLITAAILFWFATSALIQGFALVFGIGVLVSMFTAITVSRTLMFSIGVEKNSKTTDFLFGSGVFIKNK